MLWGRNLFFFGSEAMHSVAEVLKVNLVIILGAFSDLTLLFVKVVLALVESSLDVIRLTCKIMGPRLYKLLKGIFQVLRSIILIVRSLDAGTSLHFYLPNLVLIAIQ